MSESWKRLGDVGKIEAAQETKGKVSTERHYFIVSSGVKTVERFADAARAHWGIDAITG